MAKSQNVPRSPGEASRTQANKEAADATRSDKAPLPVTQDPFDSAPSEGGTVQGVPTGMLDQDRDGHAETPEVGQEHAPSENKPRPLARDPKPGDDVEPKTGTKVPPMADHAGHDHTDPKVKAFEDACCCIAGGVKKLTEAGMGGGEAGKLALEIWKHQND